MNDKSTYLPVDLDFIDQCISFAKEKKEGKIHFFNGSGDLDDVVGTSSRVDTRKSGKFFIMNDQAVRLDTIVTIFGKPGPAYETYDRYANACLTCEDLGQF